MFSYITSLLTSIPIIYPDIVTVYIRPSYRSNTQVVKNRGDTDRLCC